MGREGENLASGAGEPPSAADAPQGVGCRVWRITRGPDCRSGTKGQPPLVFPGTGLAWRAACPTSCATLQRVIMGCATYTCLAAARIGKHGEREAVGLPLVYPRLIRQECTLSGSYMGMSYAL
jgi:hypothetical protein